jgi:hypothetical protein
MPLACALAACAERRENGAMPPGVWHPAHLSAKIGATFDHVGAADFAAGRVLPEPQAMAATATATEAAAASANPILLRCTPQRYPQRPPLVKRS